MSNLERLRGWSAYHVGADGLELREGENGLRLSPVLPGVVRVRLQREVRWESPYEPLRAIPAPPPGTAPAGQGLQVRDEGNALAVDCPGGLHVRIDREPLRLTFERVQPAPVRGGGGPGGAMATEAAPPGGEPARAGAGREVLTKALWVGWDGWKVATEFTAQRADRLYGGGSPGQFEGPPWLQWNGHRAPIWNKHLPGPAARLLFPVFWSSRGYGVVFDSPWPAEVDFRGAPPGREGTWRYQAEGGALAFYFLAAESLAGLLELFTRLAGRPALPPLWALGYLQSRYGYRERAEFEAVARELRERQIPCDGLILDLYWFRHMGDLDWDEDAFPDPPGMLGGLHRMGFRVVVIEEPYILTRSRLYEEAAGRGLLARRPAAEGGRPYTFPFWAGGEAALLDFSNPETQEWWAAHHERLARLGIDGWWTDLNEPEQHYPDMIHHGGPAAAVHNLQALQMVQSVYRGQKRAFPDRRVFIMSRSGWIGMQQYGAAVWSGDVDTTWEALRAQPALGLGMGLVGVPYWNSDVGGFLPDRGQIEPELYLRWLEFGALSPLLRPHAAFQPREPWVYGPEAERLAREIIRLRYRLLPYLYTAAWEAYRSGLPVMRPLVLAYPEDDAVRDLRDEYLLGPDLLVAPVLEEGARRRRVYLPPGQWYEWHVCRLHSGGRSRVVPAPLGQPPILVRAGAIIPLTEARETAGPLPWDSLHLAVFPGDTGGGEQWLYEDDGESEAYRDGSFRLTRLRWWRDGKAILVGAGPSPDAGQAGGAGPPAWPGRPVLRRWSVEIAVAGPPERVLFHPAGQPGAPPHGLRQQASARALRECLGCWHYDPRTRTVRAVLPEASESLLVRFEW